MKARSRAGLAILGLVAAIGVLVAAAPPSEQGRAMVAADHRLASAAGAELLARGGNAVDAAVAAALSAGVVQPAGSGLGGGGFAVARLADGRSFALDFREVAPASSSSGMFLDAAGQAVVGASSAGGRSVAVPGEPVGLAELVRRYGRSSLATVAAPAIRQASKGFELGPHLGRSLARTKFPQVRQLFDVGGRVPVTGEVVRNPALARTLDRWAKTSGASLQTGEGAAAIVRAARADGGGLTAEDLAAYRAKDREPLVGAFRGYRLQTMPPPSSGGVVLLQALAVLEPFDLKSLGHNSSEYVHLVTEVLKHAYADRAHHLGDPDFAEVPVARLLAPERIDAIRRAVWPMRTFPPEHYGSRIAPPVDAGTQHISVVDAEGAAVALTTTINNPFGSGLVVSELGLILNDEMDDFSVAPGVANSFGLIGSAANEVAPGKRPLSSMTPTVVSDADGNVVLVVGASGGSTIISATLQALLSITEFGLSPQEAVSAPRFHHQWIPDVLTLEPGFPVDVVRALEARGHAVDVRDAFSAVQVVVRTPTGSYEGGSDPRKAGWPAGVR